MYKDFAMALEPKDRGLVLGNSEVIRISHNSFSRPEPFVFTGKKKAKEGDAVYHFIAYVPFRGLVYELDGLQ
jgi:ubiquitin carboxyl-terminal hydrolase L5